MSNTRTRLRTPAELAGRRKRLKTNAHVPEEAIPVIEALAGDWALDDITEALCVDCGIYLAEVLRAQHPSLEWQLWTRRSVEHNEPVLVGFSAGMPLDPVGVARTVALSVAEGRRHEASLRHFYDYWSNKVAMDAPDETRDSPSQPA